MFFLIFLQERHIVERQPSLTALVSSTHWKLIILVAIGLENLTNVVKGHYHGAIMEWSLTLKRRFGIHLLYRAYQMFLLDIPQQLFPQDV